VRWSPVRFFFSATCRLRSPVERIGRNRFRFCLLLLVLRRPDLLERRTDQIEHALVSSFLLEAKLTLLSFFTPVIQLCSTQQKPPVSASSSVLIYCDWRFGCFNFQVLVWIVTGGHPVLILSHRSKRLEVF
jgi:hypothetical protein